MAAKKKTQTVSKNKTRSSSRPGRLYLVFSAALILLAAVWGMSVFFRIHQVAVQGNTKNSVAEILKEADVKKGENLFFVDLDEVALRVIKKFPYVHNVTISRILPDKLSINITERVPVGMVELEGKLWLFDETGRVLESLSASKAEEAGSIPHITGVALSEPYVGGKLTAAEDEGDLISPVLSVLDALQENELQEGVSQISITKGFTVTFLYGGKYTVKLQIPCDIPAKISFLAKGLEQLETTESGVIDLTVDKVFRFTPQSVLDLEKELAGQQPEEEEAPSEE